MKTYIFDGGVSEQRTTIAQADQLTEIAVIAVVDSCNLAVTVHTVGAGLKELRVSARANKDTDFIDIPESELQDIIRTDELRGLGDLPDEHPVSFIMCVRYWSDVKIDAVAIASTTVLVSATDE